MYPNSTTQPVAVVDQEAVARARYFAYVQRRAMPPRCSPISILIIVLSTGMMFIGVTMTVIANWPGATTIGENPLKIAGPVLLAVGAAIFLLGIVLACVINNREQIKWEKNLTNLAVEQSHAASTQQGALVQPPGMYSDTQPLHKPGSKAARTSGAEESARDSESVPGYYSGSQKSHQDQDGIVSQLPDPIRIRKPGPIPRGNGSVSGGSANVSSEIGAADLGGIGVYSPASDDKRRVSPNAYANQGYAHSEFQTAASEAQRNRAESARRQQQANGNGGSRGDVSYQAPGHTGPQEQHHLRVHIRAQPGTAVLITPSATPPRSTPPRNTPQGTPQVRGGQGARITLSHGDSNAETEI